MSDNRKINDKGFYDICLHQTLLRTTLNDFPDMIKCNDYKHIISNIYPNNSRYIKRIESRITNQSLR